MSELVRGYGELRRSREAGRHALNEEAVLTPIFHALNRGEWRGRQQEPPARRADEVDQFRRDPLTAPIPIQAFAAAAVPSPAVAPRARRRASHALTAQTSTPEPRREGGRHHYRLETAGARGW